MSSTTSPCPAFDGLLIVVISSTFGQLIVAAGTIADFGAVILLSVTGALLPAAVTASCSSSREREGSARLCS